jgi:hypothetical protein
MKNMIIHCLNCKQNFTIYGKNKEQLYNKYYALTRGIYECPKCFLTFNFHCSFCGSEIKYDSHYQSEYKVKCKYCTADLDIRDNPKAKRYYIVKDYERGIIDYLLLVFRYCFRYCFYYILLAIIITAFIIFGILSLVALSNSQTIFQVLNNL